MTWQTCDEMRERIHELGAHTHSHYSLTRPFIGPMDTDTLTATHAHTHDS